MTGYRCPGQDTRFWKPKDIFDVACRFCGGPVEFWKDDTWRRCPHCTRALFNPRKNLGCAEWCPHASECLQQQPITKYLNGSTLTKSLGKESSHG